MLQDFPIVPGFHVNRALNGPFIIRSVGERSLSIERQECQYPSIFGQGRAGERYITSALYLRALPPRSSSGRSDTADVTIRAQARALVENLWR
jgi:hypothetical protein